MSENERETQTWARMSERPMLAQFRAFCECWNSLGSFWHLKTLCVPFHRVLTRSISLWCVMSLSNTAQHLLSRFNARRRVSSLSNSLLSFSISISISSFSRFFFYLSLVVSFSLALTSSLSPYVTIAQLASNIMPAATTS